MPIAAEADTGSCGSQGVADDACHRDLSISSRHNNPVGDDAAQTHAFCRTCNLAKYDGTGWNHKLLADEIGHQLAEAADGACPRCAGEMSALT